MLVSRDSPARVRAGLLAALSYVEPSYTIIALSPALRNTMAEMALREAAHQSGRASTVTIVPGAASRDEVAVTRWKLYDSIRTEWITNVDDDDGVLGPYPLATVPAKVGFVHSDVLGICTVASGPWRPGDSFVRRGKTITKPNDAYLFKGSYYCFRRAAWESVRKYAGTATAFEEWRVVWHMLHLGWQDHYVPQVLQYQGLRDFQADLAAYRQAGVCWENEIAKMQQNWKGNGVRKCAY